MPRLRPLKTQEAISRVPIEEPVMVELVEEEIKDAAPQDEKEKVNGKDVQETVEKVADVPEKEPVVEEKESEVPALKKQLESQKNAEKLQAEAYQRQIQEANRKTQEAELRAQTHEGTAEQAKYTAVLNAIGQAEAERDAAKKELKVAGEAGEWGAVAEAQDKLSSASARLVSLQDGKDAFEARREELKNAKPEPKQEIVQGDPVENYIEKMPNLGSREKDWLRGHKDYLTDTEKNTYLGAAHFKAMKAGHARGSDAYFQSIEQELGLREAPKAEPSIEQDEPETRNSNVAAPPSREAPSMTDGKPLSNKVTLSPAQREAAKNSGISEIEYARNVQKLAQMKKEGFYNEH